MAAWNSRATASVVAPILELEEALDRRLQEPLDGRHPHASWFETARQWSAAVWLQAEEIGPPELSQAEIERGLELAGRPVFVCGAHRSGTTLVRDLLDGHPELAVLPSEGTFYTNLRPRLAALSPADHLGEMGQEWLRRLANPTNLPPFWLLGRSTADASSYIGFARRLQAWWPVLRAWSGSSPSLWPLVAVALAYADVSGQASATLWVEKTPTNERFLGELRGEFPAAKVIHVVRHPEAALASHKAAMGDGWRLGSEVANVYRRLAESYRIAAEEARPGTPFLYHLIRYEDLRDTRDDVSRAIAEFLGIEPLPILGQPTVGGRAAYNNTSFVRGRTRANEGLTRIEEELLTLLVSPAAGSLGYRSVGERTAAARLVRLLSRSA